EGVSAWPASSRNVRQVRVTRATRPGLDGPPCLLRSSGAAASPGTATRRTATAPARGRPGRLCARRFAGGLPPAGGPPPRGGRGTAPLGQQFRGPLRGDRLDGIPLAQRGVGLPVRHIWAPAAFLDPDGPAAGRVVTQFTQWRGGGRPAPAAGLRLREQLLRLGQ